MTRSGPSSLPPLLEIDGNRYSRDSLPAEVQDLILQLQRADAVLTQWREHLLQGIVDGPKDVHVYGRGAFAKRIKEHAKHVVPQGPASYVLMTKYTLQTEFASAYDAQLDGSGRKSPLFPAAMSLLPDLHAQWRSASGRLRRGEKNSRVRKGETGVRGELRGTSAGSALRSNTCSCGREAGDRAESTVDGDGAPDDRE